MKMKPQARLASLSLDLDNMWSYMKTHGDSGWSDFPTYLDWAVPRILEFLDGRQLKITFFIVGKDAEFDINRPALKAIADAGHEIGNHSYNHEPWLHLYSEQELDDELARSEHAIENATGVKPGGFRGPGFSLSAATLKVLSRRGYRYDATVFPNLLNPLARAYFFATSSLTAEEKEQRKALFGTWRDALKPVTPFAWRCGSDRLVELPVTTMPLFRTPIHLSYILYASRYSRVLAMAYFKFAMLMCRITGTAPSILLHPLDFIGHDDLGDLDFFPGMDMDAASKIEIVDAVVAQMRRHFRLTTIQGHIDSIAGDLRDMDVESATT